MVSTVLQIVVRFPVIYAVLCTNFVLARLAQSCSYVDIDWQEFNDSNALACVVINLFLLHSCLCAYWMYVCKLESCLLLLLCIIVLACIVCMMSIVYSVCIAHILCRGETHDPVLCSFINLMKLPNEFLRGKAHQYRSEEAKRNARACHVP